MNNCGQEAEPRPSVVIQAIDLLAEMIAVNREVIQTLNKRFDAVLSSPCDIPPVGKVELETVPTKIEGILSALSRQLDWNNERLREIMDRCQL